MRHHIELYPEHEFHIVHYPINAEAPFEFNEEKKIFFYLKEDSSVELLYSMVMELNPSVVFCSGWTDKIYLRICKLYATSIPIILCFDNVWKGNLKQRMLLPFSWMVLHRIFSGVWVPGKQQAVFAYKLGFHFDRVFEGFYSTDIRFYRQAYENSIEKKKEKFPKVFLCVARYIPQKGLNYLWDAFIRLCKEEQHEWELWCAGTGIFFDTRAKHPRIKHLGFVQPNEMTRLVETAGVFVLPSISEPWGVVVHEFAAAGFPLVLSDAVGSGSAFLQENSNGFIVKGGNTESIYLGLKKIVEKTDEELIQMGSQSIVLANKISTEKWSEQLLKIANEPYSLRNRLSFFSNL